MEELLKEVLSEVKWLKDEVGGLKAEVKGISSRMDRLETKVDAMDGQLRENTDYIKSLLHRTEELDAKFDGVLHNTASKDAVARVETKIDILSHRIIAQDGELQLLKQVK